MKIALIGYGNMGKAIEQIAIAQGHEVVLKISANNIADLTPNNLKKATVAIEFTQPEAAFANVCKCLDAGIPVVSGTTGWNDQLEEVAEKALQLQTAFLHASNFSLGVNLFFAVNEQLAGIMSKYAQYNLSIEEIHHTAKKDAPSGTAITLAERIIAHYPNKKNWALGATERKNVLAIDAKRLDNIPGTHTVNYDSTVDSISLTHTAHSRDGFAQGALLAAAFIEGKRGVFTMKDVLAL